MERSNAAAATPRAQDQPISVHIRQVVRGRRLARSCRLAATLLNPLGNWAGIAMPGRPRPRVREADELHERFPRRAHP
jgi:hypothetical protein